MKVITGLQDHANYVIERFFCQTLKQAFSHICEESIYFISDLEVL